MKIKICGIRSQEMLDVCEEAGVDFVGINFVRTSKRFCSEMFQKRSETSFGSARVGVFWRNAEDEIREKIKNYNLDILQIYDADLVGKFDLPTWLALRVGQDDLNILQQKKPDLVLLDGSVPGSGQCVDKALLRESVDFVEDLGFDFGLAGGICEANVDWFLTHFSQAQFLDTASGVEDGSGAFSQTRLFKLLTLVKSA